MESGSMRSRHSSSGSPNGGKEGGLYTEDDYQHGHVRGIETSAETSLHRGLKARHISMIAIGGAIGTGCTCSLSPHSLLVCTPLKSIGASGPPRRHNFVSAVREHE